MGTISVAVVEETERGIEIPAFVLSCRVFGYGMEDALINLLKRWRPGTPIFGHFKETPHNQPCRSTYPRNGFSWEQSEWVFREGEPASDAPWLTIESPACTSWSHNYAYFSKRNSGCRRS